MMVANLISRVGDPLLFKFCSTFDLMIKYPQFTYMGENVYKMDRFLGKFRKGPPHIGEYNKKWHFTGVECESPTAVGQHPSHHQRIPYKIPKILKYILLSISSHFIHFISFYLILLISFHFTHFISFHSHFNSFHLHLHVHFISF